MDCVFCKIVKGEIPCYKIYEDDDVLAFLDIADDYAGHTLVIPKEHHENVLSVSDDILEKIILAVKKISKHYVVDCGFDGVNIVNASGESAEQTVFHLHFHIIPRKRDDKFKFWQEHEKLEQNFEEVCEQLKIKE